MMNSFFRLLLVLFGFFAVYRYRYRIMNSLLGNSWIRKVAISTSMNIPFIRDRFINQAFRF